MTRFNQLLSSPPDAKYILINRFITLALSVTPLALFASSLDTYINHVVPTSPLASPHNTLIVINTLALIACALSSLWTTFHLALLARRMRQTYLWINANAATAGFNNHDSSPLIHPLWEIIVDSKCWAFLVVMTVLTAIEANNWRSGQVEYGSEGMKQVDLRACPTFASTPAEMMDYWCGHAWNKVYNATNIGMEFMAVTAYA
ncbi:hypothetical protein MMC12_008093 [Toensbergia leucococca]|nr:hypothetical protein [Toensbergia leucococca]